MNIVIKVDEETKKKMIDYYKDKLREKTPPYAIFQAKEEDTIITLYESGKAMFQGTSADVDANMWGAVIKNDDDKETKEKKDKYYNVDAIGSDEVGTGDYFGPIVVTASLVKKEDIKSLEELGVADSKKLTDEKILEITPKIIKKVKYKTLIINNKEYNEKYNQDENMNKIKAIMHNKALYSLINEVGKPSYVIVDQFTPEDKYYFYIKDVTNKVNNITFMTKAEDKNLAVAASSIISRYVFLKELDKISDKYKIPIPKGSGANVDSIGKELIDKYGEEILDDIAKKNFSNTKKILGTLII